MDFPELPPRPATSPWDRDLEESSQDFTAFQTWLAYPGPAPLDAAMAERLGYTVASLRAVAVRWRWSQRRAAWETAVRYLKDRAYSEVAKDLTEELLGGALASLRWATQSIQAAMARGVELKPETALAYQRTMIEAVRLLRGEATEIIETRDMSRVPSTTLDQADQELTRIEGLPEGLERDVARAAWESRYREVFS